MTLIDVDDATCLVENDGDYALTISNCNSITEAVISLRRGALNIKYGPNGLGKSTIARALELNAKDGGDLADLTPFKERGSETPRLPAVTGAESIKNVLTFNDAYVAQFVFKPTEVLDNSFEIFINTDEYKAGLEEIESIFESLKDTFVEHDEFNEAIHSFTDLRDAFGVTKAGKVAKNSKGAKALSVGGKLENIPKHLEGYTGFIKSENPADWITWQARGKAYLDLSDNCPFCSSASLDKDTASQVSTEYNSASVKNMSALRAAIQKLGKYFEPSHLEQLTALTSAIDDMTPEQENFLLTLRSQVETLLGKLTSIRGLSFHALRDERNVASTLGSLTIDLSLLRALESEASKAVVDSINAKLKDVVEQVADVGKGISAQKRTVGILINNNQRSINEFLASAGYKYEVRIEPDGDSYRMLLEHQDHPGHLESASSHLSYGERNAFALVLFMHHVRWAKPDLVVLDDPVSSFDKTKKFAILHQLFNGKNSILGVTSLLLTHDLEPAIDVVRTGTSKKFEQAEPSVRFLMGREGVVSEKPISAGDIKTFSQVCEENISSSSDLIIKCIYQRRLLEVHGARGAGYELLSNLLHAREVPVWKRPGLPDEDMSVADIATATAEIRLSIPDFDYARLLESVRNLVGVKERFDTTSVGYEKVQLFRIMTKISPAALNGDTVFSKFVNETYHIENEYLMQLNPREFDAVPDYVITSCEEMIGKAAVE